MRKTKLNAGRKKAEKGEVREPPLGTESGWSFTGKPQTHSDTQINGDGLV